MTIADKYRKVLEIKKKKVYKAEDECGFGRNTLANAIKDNRMMSEEYHNKFIKHYSVNPIWWETEKGEVLTKNSTDVNNSTGSDEKARDEIYRDLVENNSAYRLVPKSILDEEYRIVLKSEIELKDKMLRDLLDAKNQLIDQLHQEIKELRSIKQRPVPTK